MNHIINAFSVPDFQHRSRCNYLGMKELGGTGDGRERQENKARADPIFQNPPKWNKTDLSVVKYSVSLPNQDLYFSRTRKMRL